MLPLLLVLCGCSNNHSQEPNNSQNKIISNKKKALNIANIFIDESLNNSILLQDTSILTSLAAYEGFNGEIDLSYVVSTDFWQYFAEYSPIFAEEFGLDNPFLRTEIAVPSLALCVATCGDNTALIIPYQSSNNPIITIFNSGTISSDYFNLASIVTFSISNFNDFTYSLYQENSIHISGFDLFDTKQMWS